MIYRRLNINLTQYCLKDKPANTKLYSPLFGEVYFSHVGGGNIAVEHHGGISLFFSSGRFFDYDESEPLLFPSKEMRDWRKFAWKKGDVLKNTAYEGRVIFDGFLNDDYTYFKGKHPLDCSNKLNITYHEECNCLTGNYRLESTDAAQTYINTIEERLGGKLNRETLEVEKAQPEFKDGDVLFVKCEERDFIEIFNYSKKNGDLYDYASLDTLAHHLDISGKYKIGKEDIVKIRLATEEEKKQFFSYLEKEGKAWDSEKKQVVDLKPKVELKPFDKVLVRNSNLRKWEADLFGFKSGTELYHCVGGSWSRCIPYEGNEYLLGTTKDVEG